MSAEKHCRAHGLRGPTEVARAVGVTKATIHNWFNKESPLFLAAVDYAVKLRQEATARDIEELAGNTAPSGVGVNARLVRWSEVRLELKSGAVTSSRTVYPDSRNWPWVVGQHINAMELDF